MMSNIKESKCFNTKMTCRAENFVKKLNCSKQLKSYFIILFCFEILIVEILNQGLLKKN